MTLEFWLRLAAVPGAIVLLAVFGYVLAPVSRAIRRWMPNNKLKRFLLTPAGARWGTGPGEKAAPESRVLTDWNKRIVERLPPSREP